MFSTDNLGDFFILTTQHWNLWCSHFIVINTLILNFVIFDTFSNVIFLCNWLFVGTPQAHCRTQHCEDFWEWFPETNFVFNFCRWREIVVNWPVVERSRGYMWLLTIGMSWATCQHLCCYCWNCHEQLCESMHLHWQTHTLCVTDSSAL